MTGLKEADDGGRRPRDLVGEGSLDGDGGREFGRENPVGRIDVLCEVGVAAPDGTRCNWRICATQSLVRDRGRLTITYSCGSLG